MNKYVSLFKRFVVACFIIGLSPIFGETYAHADFTCDIDFAYGIAVNGEQIRVLDKSRTKLQINGNDQLFIEGRLQALDKQQQKWLEEYAEGLHYVVPKMIVLATEGVDLAADTVEHVYLGLVGNDHESYERLTSSMKRVKSKVRDKFRHASNHYFIGPGSLESVDEFVDAEIEAQLGESISTSIGGILSAISGISSENGEISEERVAELTRQLGMMGEQIERDVGPRANSLRNKARWFCNKLRRLDKAEENLRNTIPALRAYDIITTDPEAASSS